MKNKDPYNYYQVIGPDGLIDNPTPILPKLPEPKVRKQVHKPISTNNGILYHFKGAVMRYQTCLMSNFETWTIAVSKDQAKSRILFQAKKKLNLLPGAGGIRLEGKLEEIERV